MNDDFQQTSDIHIHTWAKGSFCNRLCHIIFYRAKGKGVSEEPDPDGGIAMAVSMEMVLTTVSFMDSGGNSQVAGVMFSVSRVPMLQPILAGTKSVPSSAPGKIAALDLHAGKRQKLSVIRTASTDKGHGRQRRGPEDTARAEPGSERILPQSIRRGAAGTGCTG